MIVSAVESSLTLSYELAGVRVCVCVCVCAYMRACAHALVCMFVFGVVCLV